MAGLDRFDNRVWDTFFDFVAPDVEQMTTAEVEAELQHAGIDVTAAFAQVQQALEAQRARQALERARAQRPSITQQLADIVSGPIANARQILHEMISSRAPQALRPVLFRKLEKAASDEDVESLLQDMRCLDHLELGDGDGKP